MAGYVASGRLQGAVPRFAGASPRNRGAAVQLGIEMLPVDGLGGGLAAFEAPIADQFELVGRPIDEAIREWLASIGEAWSQTTFYLFDSESWR